MELPPPEVTVIDPREPGRFIPVHEPEPPRLGRRGAALLAAAATAGAAVLFTADLVRGRQLDRVVDVELGAPRGGWSSWHDPSTGTGSVEGPVRLRNEGPRDVRVTSARLGGLQAEDDTLLKAGGSAVVVLRRTVRCPRDGGQPPPEPEAGQLELGLETPTGPRTVVLEGSGLPIGSLDDSVQRACAYPPLRESVQLASAVVGVEGREAVLQVDVANEGRRPVRLLSLVPSRGLVVLAIDGEPARLPIVLREGTADAPPVRRLEVRLGVVCSALLGASTLAPLEELAAIVEDEDRMQISSIGTLSRDPDRQLRQLARRACPSG